ncbi:AraC family transcriptional regulator ligand-binding domain-containing protein [Nocardia iowensis]|uniref:AraC family transcriptional regulator n=2 Tax=Nocardia iowensis TaxID=204891 RepID=A0ABX8RFP2_NOCIO|nr:AraC family transcriptional regulator [Nocardia iowensis]QXN88428.1 AraC family transcriptional regulator [Nocardia iowensis]
MMVAAVSVAPGWDHPRAAAAARILVEVGTERGMTVGACLAGSGLRAEDLVAPGFQLEAGQELTVARNLIRALGDSPGLGTEAGRRYTIASLGIWGYAILSSPTLREVLRLGVRYAELSFAFIQPVLEESGAEVAVVFDDEQIPADVRDFFVERELAKIAHLLPVAVDPRHRVRIETRFTGPRAAALAAVLGDVSLRSGAPRHRIVVQRTALDASLPHADPIAVRELEAQCLRTLEARRARRGVAAHVRSLVLAELDTGPTMARIADYLHIDARTLRRRLRAEGTTYRELVDEVRAAIADELLAAGLTLADVARRLGYHDAAGFSRAYRRWTGTAPGRSRR